MPQKKYSASHFLFSLPVMAARAAVMLVILCLLCACIQSSGTPITASDPGILTQGAPGSSAQTTPGSSTQAAPAIQAAAPTATAEIGSCSLGELSASMEWHRVSGALDARLVLANFGSRACAVKGAPQIELVNQNGWKLPVDQEQNSAGPAPARVVLDPAAGYTTVARFVWRNWCTPASQENLHLEVILPGYPGKLNVPVQDPNGHFLPDTPHCDDPSAPSTLTIEAFK